MNQINRSKKLLTGIQIFLIQKSKYVQTKISQNNKHIKRIIILIKHKLIRLKNFLVKNLYSQNNKFLIIP